MGIAHFGSDMNAGEDLFRTGGAQGEKSTDRPPLGNLKGQVSHPVKVRNLPCVGR